MTSRRRGRVDKSGNDAAVSLGQCEKVSFEMCTRDEREAGTLVRLGECDMTMYQLGAWYEVSAYDILKELSSFKPEMTSSSIRVQGLFIATIALSLASLASGFGSSVNPVSLTLRTACQQDPSYCLVTTNKIL